MPPNDLDFELLRKIADQQASNQRELAVQLGVSVGSVNYCLRAIIEKGWVKVNNFRRADNKWAYAYLLTPNGLATKLKLTKEFLTRKEQEFERLQDEIHRLRAEIDQGVDVPEVKIEVFTTGKTQTVRLVAKRTSGQRNKSP